MRVICLMMFALFFTLGSLCTNSSDTPPGDGEAAGTGEPDKPQTSVSSPADEGQKENVCQFKEDHIVSEVGALWFGLVEGQPVTVSGPNLIVKGSDTPTGLVEIIDEGGAWFGKDLSKGKFSPAEGGGIILPYEYTGEDYKDWCPMNGEKCVVEVIYKGVDEKSIYKKEKTHPKVAASRYVYKGNLTIQILFSDQVLDFSACN